MLDNDLGKVFFLQIAIINFPPSTHQPYHAQEIFGFKITLNCYSVKKYITISVVYQPKKHGLPT